MREVLVPLIDHRLWYDRAEENGALLAGDVQKTLNVFRYGCWEADVALEFAAHSIACRRLRFTDPLMKMLEASAVFEEAVVAKTAYQLVLGISEPSKSFMIIYEKNDRLRELLHRCLE